ncbi:hypothetical protein RJ641_018384, partial [Dillenia turbinata]
MDKLDTLFSVVLSVTMAPVSNVACKHLFSLFYGTPCISRQSIGELYLWEDCDTYIFQMGSNIDMKNLIGEASCRICQESFSTTVT